MRRPYGGIVSEGAEDTKPLRDWLVWRSALLTKRLMQLLSNLLINQSAFASKLPRGHL